MPCFQGLSRMTQLVYSELSMKDCNNNEGKEFFFKISCVEVAVEIIRSTTSLLIRVVD